MPLQLPAAARHRRPERAPDGFPFCPDCLETGWRWRQAAQGEAWVGPCHCGRTVDPPQEGSWRGVACDGRRSAPERVPPHETGGVVRCLLRVHPVPR